MSVWKKLGRIKATEDYWKRRTIANNYPSVTAIELTNKCNFRCTFCPSFIRKSGYMDIDLLRSILEKTRFSDSLVQLHFHGESLLHPKLGEMISLCKEFGLRVGLSTNASLLDEKRSETIIESGLDEIILAFDGVSKEIFEKYRVNANYEKVKRRMLDFLEFREAKNSKIPFVDLHVIKLEEAKPQIDDFIEYWSKTPVDQITVKSFSTRAGQVNASQASTKDWYFGKRSKRYPCRWFWSSVIILWDGRVVPCCHDMQGKIIIGDLKKQTLEEIWNGKKMQALREAEMRGHHASICADCNEWYGHPPGLHGFLFGAIADRVKRLVGYGVTSPTPIFDVRYRRKDYPAEGGVQNVPLNQDLPNLPVLTR